jgi:hypothetical protein
MSGRLRGGIVNKGPLAGCFFLPSLFTRNEPVTRLVIPTSFFRTVSYRPVRVRVGMRYVTLRRKAVPGS